MVFPLIMSTTGDMNKNWQQWKTCFLLYLNSCNYTVKQEEKKIELLKKSIGSDALNVPQIFDVINNNDFIKFRTLTHVLERLDLFFCVMRNELVERYNFFNRFLQKDESIEIYILDLKEKAKTCNFGRLTDSIIRDIVIANLRDKELRSKLFKTLNLDLTTLLNICKVHEHKSGNNNGRLVEKKQTKTNPLHRDNVVIVEAANSTRKTVAEETQNLNKKEIANINDKSKQDFKNIDSGNNKVGTACRRNSNSNNKTTTDSKVDNSSVNITDTACQKNSNIYDKTKNDFKNINSGNNITGTTCQRNSNSNNKTMPHPKSDNSGNNIVSTACRRNSNSNTKPTTDSKVDNSSINITDTACQKNSNIHDKTKQDYKNINSENNITGTTCRRNSNSNNKTMPHPKSDNSGNNIVSTACRRNSNSNTKTTTDSKVDNSSINITDTACQKNSNIHDKTKQDYKNINSENNITGTTCRRNSNSNNKTTTYPKSDNSGNNTVGTACRRNSNSNRMTNAVPKIDRSYNGPVDFKENYINDNTKIDSKCVHSNHNMNMAGRNIDISATQYRRNCWRCNEKHAQRCCPAWGSKCVNCGERNHFTNCCKMNPVRREQQHMNMILKENVSSSNTIQHENKPKPIAPSNNNLIADIGSQHVPSAPEFCEIENELYPNLHVSTISSVPLNPEARIDNTESEKTATGTPNLNRHSKSGRDSCSVS